MINQTKFPQKPEKFAWSFVKKHPFACGIEVLIYPLVTLSEQLIPWIISRVVDMANTSKSPEVVWEYVNNNLWVVFALVFGSAVMSFSSRLYVYYRLTIDLAANVYKKLFASILPHSLRFWHKNPSGTIYNKMGILRRGSMEDGGMMGGYISLYHNFVSMSIILFFVAKIYIPLAIILLFFAVFITYFLSASSKTVERNSEKLNKIRSKTFGYLVDMCTNHFLVKTFGSKKREYGNYYKELEKREAADVAMQTSYANHTIMQQALSLCLQVFLILYAVYLWANKLISVGDVVYIMTTLIGLVLRFRIWGYIILGIKDQRGAMRSAISTFNEPYEIVGGNKALKVKQGSIEIKDLSFSYDGKKSVLKNINLNIAPQEKIGIVGVSGGGKTTLIHLLQRIFDYNKGSIKIDGQDIKDVSLESLYQNVAFIPQDTSLFHRSISENISYGKFNASNKKIKEVAKHSYVDEFIEKLPDGYDTLVGDKGVKLSGGQRQRVGIARAIIKDAPILLLDEATSALDSKSEKYIQKAIKEIIKDKTVIAVAHRLSTLKDMDRIIVIDNGKIIEEGSPQKLLDKKGKFAKLWHIQMS